MSFDLTPQQQAVVDAPAGTLLVIAGAGSGKTRTLTARFARLVEEGCPPERMMLVTFTNRAAREMIHQVEAKLSTDLGACAAGTFHHVGHRLLRTHAESLGFRDEFGVMTPSDCVELIGSVVTEIGYDAIDPKHFPSARQISSMISQARGAICTLGEVVERTLPDAMVFLPMLEEIASSFATRKRSLNLMDFDDLLFLWLELLRDPSHQQIGDTLRAAYDHLLVDEYQDINKLQGAIISEMSREHGSLTCVGDDAQSIYAFRGADFSQIFEFMGLHPSAEVLTLTTNYRSTPEIVALANRSISCNVNQHPKELVPSRQPGRMPAAVMVGDVMQQAEFVVQRALELHYEQGIPLHKIALLYRNHKQVHEVVVELLRHGIPFSIASSVRFFDLPHIKDVMAIVRLYVEPQNTLAWCRVLQRWLRLQLHEVEPIALWLSGRGTGPPQERLAAFLAIRMHEGFETMLASFERLARADTPSELIRQILDFGLPKRPPGPVADAWAKDIVQLAAFAERWTDPYEFLSHVTLEGNASPFFTHAAAGEIVLSTIHQAKGLEWSAVFVLWVNEGRLPNARASSTPSSLEEERRLFYVAITRAADHLFLLFPTRLEFGNRPCKLLHPSRFLIELDHEPPVFEYWELEGHDALELDHELAKAPET